MFLFRFIFYFFLGIFILGIILMFLLKIFMKRTFGNKPSTKDGNRSTNFNNFKSPKKKKIIEKNEGDYIDYEEVK